MKSTKKLGAPPAPRNYRKEIGRGDLTVESALKEIKEEIVEEVRRLAGGYQQSVGHLINHLGKEMVELEKMLADARPSTTAKSEKPSTKKAASGGIKAIADDEEIGEDDF